MSIASNKLEQDVLYRMDCDADIGTRVRLAKGTLFKVIKFGGSWDNHTEIEIIDGHMKLTVHSTFFVNKIPTINSMNGGGHYIHHKVLAVMLGIESINDLTIGFDPYGVREYPFTKTDIEDVKNNEITKIKEDRLVTLFEDIKKNLKVGDTLFTSVGSRTYGWTVVSFEEHGFKVRGNITGNTEFRFWSWLENTSLYK